MNVVAGLLASFAICAACWSQPVRAHATQLSSAQIELRGKTAKVRLEMNARDLDIALGSRLMAGTGVDPQELQRAGPQLFKYAQAHVRLTSAGDARCGFAPDALAVKNDHVVLTGSWSCPPAASALSYHADLFQEIDPAAKHMVTVTGDVNRIGLLAASNPRLALGAPQASAWAIVARYFLAGVEHIAIGYDHIAFLVAVILWGRRIWPLVGVVTAFTVAHSITLAVAVLDVVNPPARLVEILIALSIVYVAAENFFVRDMRHRWMITFAFGLVHGFGFASVLKEYGLPRDALFPALASFNAGVEVGQVAIVLLVEGAKRSLRFVQRAPARGAAAALSPRLVRAISTVILLLGLYWTAQRVLQ